MATSYTPYSDFLASTSNNTFTSDTTTIFTSGSTNYTRYNDTYYSNNTDANNTDANAQFAYNEAVKRTESLKKIMDEAIEDQLWTS